MRDLALIERARVSLASGFTVISGETGAGKSLHIDALALVLGAVIRVTHLPQIAAHADVHLRISKEVREGRSTTEIVHLDDGGRRAELALMLGGSAADAGALAAADELLARAAAARDDERGEAGARSAASPAA